MLNLPTALVAFASAFVLAVPAFAEWGDLKIKFKLTKPMRADRAADIRQHRDCADVPVFDSNAVGPNLEVPNVMVWLNVADVSKVKVRRALAEKTAANKPTLKMIGCQIDPHCLFAAAGQTLVIRNEDAFAYAPNLGLAVNRPMNPIIPRGQTFEKEVEKPENRPTAIACNIHPNTFGYVMIAPTPYHAVSSADGTIVIKDLPVGSWKFKFWHEVHGNITKVERKGMPESWPKGVATLSIIAGENDLGEIKIVPQRK